MKQRIVVNKYVFLGIVVFGLFFLFSLTETKNFAAWPQVTVLWDSGWPLTHFINHFHFERYLVSYVGLTLEDMYPGVGFSIYISVFVAINTLLFRQMHKAFTGHPPALLAYAVFFALHLAMNGRGPLGWCGWLLCLSLHSKYSVAYGQSPFMTVKHSSILFLSILFSSVSSGVFMVVFIANVLLILRVLRGSVRRQRFTLGRIFSLLFATAIIGFGIWRAVLYMLDALLKIRLFYGSYAEVINHGVGLLAQIYDLSILLMAITVLLSGFFVAFLLLKDRIAPILWPLFLISLVGGAFGFTTLTLSIPIFLIFMSSLTRLFLNRTLTIGSPQRLHT